jgi:hypothetical protein
VSDEDTHVEGPTRPPDVGDVKDVAVLEEIVAQRDAQWQDDLRLLLTSPAGRRVLWAVIDRAGIHANGYSESHAWMAMTEGGRAFGVWLVKELTKVDERAYPQLMIDAGNDRALERLMRETALQQKRAEQA